MACPTSLLLIALLFATALSDYSENLAAKMINLSASTYNYQLDSKTARCPSCYSSFLLSSILQKESLLALIGYDPHEAAVIVAFRGSDNLNNWIIDDFRLYHIQYDGCERCRVHAGFYHAYEGLEDNGLIERITKSINDHRSDQHPVKKIIFTGHSLGGAIANIAALKCREEGYAGGLEVQLYTFGQPRVGNSFYAAYHQALVRDNYRVVHYGDCIVHKPLRSLSFLHSGEQIWYNYDMSKMLGTCLGDSPDCSNSLEQGLFSAVQITIIDHIYQIYQKLKINMM